MRVFLKGELQSVQTFCNVCQKIEEEVIVEAKDPKNPDLTWKVSGKSPMGMFSIDSTRELNVSVNIKAEKEREETEHRLLKMLNSVGIKAVMKEQPGGENGLSKL